jgi:hypothetical protein
MSNSAGSSLIHDSFWRKLGIRTFGCTQFKSWLGKRSPSVSKVSARETGRSGHVSVQTVSTVARASSEPLTSPGERQLPNQQRQGRLAHTRQPDAPPASIQGQVCRLWITLTWSKAGRASVLIFVPGIAPVQVFISLGLLAHAIIGIRAIGGRLPCTPSYAEGHDNDMTPACVELQDSSEPVARLL